MKAGDIEVLRQIADYEKTMDFSQRGTELGWSWRDVRMQPAVLTRLYLEGLIDCPFKSNSYTGYLLSEAGKQLLEAEEITLSPSAEESAGLELPADLFEIIEGYYEIKDVVRTIIKIKRPVHLLFTGVPASAKTMFLMELARLGAPYVLGSQASRAGIAQVLLDTKPRILLVDEIDRIGSKDISVLLSLMATGIVSETKHNKRREVRLDTRVFAASNTLNLAPEVLSRFMVLEFARYQVDDFMRVAVNILIKQEGIDRELASYIALKVWQGAGRYPDPRQAVRIARLANTKEEVDKVFNLLKRYGR